MALELVTFKKTPTTEDEDRTTLEVNEQNLELVLEKCEGRPLSIVCICGPSRQGKSFILGHIIRCLGATEKGVEDWMDWDNPHKPLGESFAWYNGYRPVTKGIWIWNKPFIVTREGKEIAVILMDTQGTSDEFTSNRDMTTIVGLSLLMSSVMIFNFFTNLQEDILSSLTTYIEYGKMALENGDENKTKPFQKLKFLIRDWNNPTQFQYGEEGGKEFIQLKMQIKAHQPENARKVRETVTHCFNELDCFLMPAIGEKALHQKYDGNIADLSEKFTENMEIFINNLTMNELLTKKIVGHDITPEDFHRYVKAYTQVFNSNTIPSALSMWEATTFVANTSTLERSMHQFLETFQQKQENKAYLNPTDLDEALKFASEQAIKFFNNSKTFGKTTLLETTLREKVKNELEFITNKNDSIRQKMLRVAEEEVETSLQQAFSNYFSFDGSSPFYADSYISEVGAKNKKILLESYALKLFLETEQEKSSKIKQLDTKYEAMMSSTKITNQMKRNDAEKADNRTVEKASSVFDQIYEKRRGNKKYLNPTGLAEALLSATQAANTLFKTSKIYGERKQFEENLKQKLNQKSETLKIEHENIRLPILIQARQDVEQIFRQIFSDKIRQHPTNEDTFYSESDISQLAKNAKQKTFDAYLGYILLETPQEKETRKGELSSKLDDIISTDVDNYNARKSIVDSKRKLQQAELVLIESAEGNADAEFKRIFTDVFPLLEQDTNKYYPESKISESGKEAKMMVMTNYQTATVSVEANPETDIRRRNITERMEAAISKAEDLNKTRENTERLCLAKIEADKEFKDMFIDQYASPQRSCNDYYLISKVSEAGVNAKEKVLGRFRAAIHNLMLEGLDDEIQKLDQKLSSAILVATNENHARIEKFAEDAAYEEFNRLFTKQIRLEETYSISLAGKDARSSALQKYSRDICGAFTEAEETERRRKLEERINATIIKVEKENKECQDRVFELSVKAGTSTGSAIGGAVGVSLGAAAGPIGVAVGGVTGTAIGAGVGAITGAITGAFFASKHLIRSRLS